MPATIPVLEYIARSDVGKTRDHNEDSILVRPDLGLALLADGLGGYNAGEVASQRVVAFLNATLEPFIQDPPDYATLGELLSETIRVANRNIYRESRAHTELRGMATTLVAVLFRGDKMIVAHVGDSRLYRLRSQSLTQVTRDHSVYQSMLEQDLVSAENINLIATSGMLTRAVGVEPEVEVELNEYDVEPGDCYLLCSDGLTDMLADREIALTLNEHSHNLENAAQTLIQLANEWGGRDNVSVVLVRSPKLDEAPADDADHDEQ